jgi:hypothetical protein
VVDLFAVAEDVLDLLGEIFEICADRFDFGVDGAELRAIERMLAA